MPRHPLCEVFGFPYNDFRKDAVYHRDNKLCPYNNIVPQCTKDKKKDPLGVCSMLESEEPIIICPVRFRQSWRIIDDTAPFLLPNATHINFVTEPTLKDAKGNTIGKIDIVLIDHGEEGNIVDFAPLEIQSVYISGNIRNPFSYYIGDPQSRYDKSWEGENYPSPDWLSSVKRTIHQITAKGIILVNSWKKHLGIAAQQQFFYSFPLFSQIPEVPQEEANCVWFLYNLVWDSQEKLFELKLERTIYFKFSDFLNTFSSTVPGNIKDFSAVLEKKLAKKLYKTTSKKRNKRSQISESQLSFLPKKGN